MIIPATVISLTILIAFQISFSEAVDCDDKPDELELIDPNSCWYFPEMADVMFNCDSNLESKNISDFYRRNRDACGIDCALQNGEIIKDMKLNSKRFINEIKTRSLLTFDASGIEKATDKCFPLAEEKLATLRAEDFNDTDNCNTIPKKLMNCISAMILVNAINTWGPTDPKHCKKLKDFYKTCDFVF